MEFDDLNCVQRFDYFNVCPFDSDINALYLRRIRTDSLDVHPTEKAIVVNYELEASLVGDLGDTMLEESRQCQKMYDSLLLFAYPQRRCYPLLLNLIY